MIRKRVSYLLLLGATAVFAACEHDVDGELVTANPVAGLRYVNLVPDTGGMDIRIVDIIGDAPNTFNATFRSAGQHYGISSSPASAIPMHTAVLAGTRTIRAFMSSSNPDVATTVMLDTSLTFDANNNYTVYMYGYSRSGSTPRIQAFVTLDNPADPGTQVAVRAVHLAPTLAPTITGTSVDVYVDALALGTTPSGTATFTAVTPGSVTSYVNMAVGTTSLNYRAAVAANTTTTPLINADVPNGATGTSTTDPTPGERVAGTAVSIVIAPPSVSGSTATSFTTPGFVMVVDRLPPRTRP